MLWIVPVPGNTDDQCALGLPVGGLMCPLEARFLGVGEVIVQLRRHIVLVCLRNPIRETGMQPCPNGRDLHSSQ